MDPAVLWAAAAALIVQCLNLGELRNIPKAQRPDLAYWVYWVPFVISPIAGGVLALAYVDSNVKLPPILALNVGAAAPIVFRNWSKASKGPPGPSD